MALALAAVGLASPCPGQSSPAAPASPDQDQERPAPSPSQQLPDHQAPGSVSGTIVDQSGAVVPGARVKLTHEDQSHQGQTQTQTQPQKDQSPALEVVSGDNGQFSFTNVTPGAFQLTVTAAGFASQTPSGILHPGETLTVPQIALAVAANVTDVQVSLSRVEVAEEQIKDQEKQRVLGVFPNFYVTYDPHPVALTSKQKFELAWKTTIDPVTFVIVGGIAGIQQAENSFGGYGQGAEGYAKRYGASYADLAFGTFLGSAIFPSLLKQDPRYFYKGTGSIRSRSLYAIANAVICKGDNGRWQVNYSNILGNLAAGGISNLYYPSQNRNGAGLTFENAVIGIGATAAANLVEEFLMRKLTPNLPKHNQPKPEGAL
jgi:hypothetical protein